MRAVIQAEPGKAEEDPIVAAIGGDDNAAGYRPGADPRRHRSSRHRLLTAGLWCGLGPAAAPRG
jgi:hypothetical protein